MSDEQKAPSQAHAGDAPAGIGRGTSNGTLRDMDEALKKYLNIRGISNGRYNGAHPWRRRNGNGNGTGGNRGNGGGKD